MLRTSTRILGAVIRIGIVVSLFILITACLDVEGEVEITNDPEFEAFMNRQRCFFGQYEFCNCFEPGTETEALFCEINCDRIEPFFPEMVCS